MGPDFSQEVLFNGAISRDSCDSHPDVQGETFVKFTSDQTPSLYLLYSS